MVDVDGFARNLFVAAEQKIQQPMGIDAIIIEVSSQVALESFVEVFGKTKLVEVKIDLHLLRMRERKDGIGLLVATAIVA